MSNPVDDRELKARFAREWARRPDEPFRVAFGLIPDTTGAALACTAWQKDPEVLAELARIRGQEPQAATLPTKEDLARGLWDMSEDLTKSYNERLAAKRQYAEVMGFIQKPGVTANVTVPVVNRVMKVREYATPDSWETAGLNNQRKLVADARSNTQH